MSCFVTERQQITASAMLCHRCDICHTFMFCEICHGWHNRFYIPCDKRDVTGCLRHEHDKCGCAFAYWYANAQPPLPTCQVTRCDKRDVTSLRWHFSKMSPRWHNITHVTSRDQANSPASMMLCHTLSRHKEGEFVTHSPALWPFGHRGCADTTYVNLSRIGPISLVWERTPRLLGLCTCLNIFINFYNFSDL